MKLSTTVVFHDELEFLPGWYESAKTYSDEIIMASHAAKDGSLEWAKEMQSKGEIPIKILEFPENTIYEYGFSYMKNKCIDEATGDWIVSLDPDEEMDITKEGLKPFMNSCCISTATMHVANPKPHWNINNKKQIKKEAEWIRQRHFRIFENIPEIRWHGLIHEELKGEGVNGQIHIASIARTSNFTMWHYGCLAKNNNKKIKEGLYAELLCRIVDNPELRDGTNTWWFTEYYKGNETKLREQQKKYEEYARLHFYKNYIDKYLKSVKE